MENIPNQKNSDEAKVKSSQEDINRHRDEFLAKAEALAIKYNEDVRDVITIFAASEGKQVEKHLDNQELLEKLFTEDEFRDDARWEMVEEKLKLEVTKLKLKKTEIKLEESEKNAMTDALTGLNNRRALDQEIKRREEVFKRDAFSGEPKPFSYIILDIDNFKYVNDYFGHTTGDDVLKMVANVIKPHTRANDFVGRYGGEEISVLVDGNIATATLLAERIRENIASIEAKAISKIGKEEKIPITASFGVSEYRHTKNEDDIATMKKTADAALYVAKGSGRNQVQVASLDATG
jgi:diguanylate cyclase